MEVDKEKSEALTLNYGVPQGSILGPLLFLIQMNDIHIKSAESISLYCDDTSAIVKGQNHEETSMKKMKLNVIRKLGFRVID